MVCLEFLQQSMSVERTIELEPVNREKGTESRAAIRVGWYFHAVSTWEAIWLQFPTLV